MEPGDITVTQGGDHIKNSVVKGSETQIVYQQLEDQREKIEQRWKVVMDTLKKVNERSNTAYQQLKDWVLTPYFAESDELELNFMRNNPQSAVTAYLLKFYVGKMKLDTLQRYYDALGPAMQSSHNGKYVAKEIVLLKNGSPGSIAADFQTIGLNGRNVALSQFKGKYVLLDFWAAGVCLVARVIRI